MKEEMFKCEKCERNFKSEDALRMHNSSKHSKKLKKEKTTKINLGKIKNWLILVAILGVVFYGIFWGFSSIKTLPPTTMDGHVEQSPSSHVLNEPMPLEIQKHMLEHADGNEGGIGGIIINYNCKDYECEEDLIENLESFAKEFPSNVYVAPFKNMDAKIVLTQLNKIEILEEYNEEKIRSFITGY